ncbi:DivIVA domain-containing protein [Micromonospora sp. NPDC051006]|uniref:DivIVA domain-containing protein n=1 Tax=Micromonospora sp. NPDC051006 TaxID=3364283 RepID=UPI0037AD6937
MELRKSRRLLVLGLVFLAFGAAVLLCGAAGGSPPSVGAWILGGLALVIGGALVVSELKPFTFQIGADGLTLRTAGLNRLMPWSEIDAIILDQPVPTVGGSTSKSPTLLLVPADGSTIGRPLDGQSAVDGRAGLVLLDLDDVRQKTDEVAAALARFGGDRFTDARQLRRQRFDAPDFAVGLRGYDPVPVDALIRRGQDALMSESVIQRYQIKAEFERARAGLVIAMRGYDVRQVDAFLDELSAALARWGDEGAEPEQTRH